MNIGLDFPNIWVDPNSIIDQVRKVELGLFQV